MRILSIIVKTVAFLGFAAVAATTAAKEPHWHYPEFQKPVIDWLKSNTAEDVSVNVVSITRPELTEAEARKYFYTTKNGKYPLLSVVATQLATPAEAYLWEGGIWRADQPVVQSFLKDKSHGLDSGQLWIPGHPNAANVLAWIYQLDEPWNPYYKNAAVAKRAAIISLVDLLVQPENSFYYGDARSTNPGRKFIGKDGTWNVHPGQKGFTLTFQAFTMLHTRDLVPAPVRSAWHEGFKLIADRFYVSSNTGPGNMLLSGAIAFQYARLATQDPYYDKLYQYWQDRIVTGKMLSPAGVYYDGFNRAPDASYEGIALHRIAELYAINPTETVRDILEKSYTLKSYMTIVEPDGSRISPSHFNDRCASGFATDQYGGREVMIAADIPAVAPFLRAVWPEKIDPEKVADMMMRTSQKTISASPGPYPWGKGNGAHYRMFDWEGVLQLPYVLYYQDPDKLSEVISNGPGYPLLEFDRYTKNFGDEFYAVRRPAYAAWFYTGHANASDSGATNLKGAVKGDGGYFNGFAGGGLSAFWVPEAGTGLIGRITATEGYQRVTKHNRFVPGWMDWANNHIIGVLDSGKILTSARTSRPENRIETQADGTERLTIASDFVANLRKQGNILNHPGSYRRSYAFFDSHIAVDVAVKFWGPTRFKTLHETLPVYFPGSVSIHYFNGDHQPLDPGDTKRVTDVSFVVMQRENGGTALAFPTPVAIDSGSEKIVSRQQGPPVPVKALQIFFPGIEFLVRDSAGISYDIVPFTGQWSAEQYEKPVARESTALFPVEKQRPNLLNAPQNLSDSVWKKSAQGDGDKPLIGPENVATFDVSRGKHYSSRSKISQQLEVTPGARYRFWIRARSNVPARLSIMVMTGINKGREDRSFVVSPDGWSETAVEMTAVEAGATCRIRMVWNEDFDRENLSTKAQVTFGNIQLERLE